jgi:hypothetical protein
MLIGGDVEHVPEPERTDLRAQLRVPAVDFVTGDPPGRDACVDGASEHGPGQRRLGGELDTVRDTCLAAAFAVVGPLFR